jgi:ribosome-associated translation inhibitor RaiA
MKRSIQARHFPLSPALRVAVEAAMRALDKRYGHIVRSVTVRLFDTNGKRGGPDKGCLIVAEVAGKHRMVATAVDADLYAAISQAFDKLARATEGLLGRARSKRRRPIFGLEVVPA